MSNLMLILLAASGFPAWSVIFFIAGIAFLIFSLIYGAVHSSPVVFWARTDLGLALKVIFEL